MEEEYVQGEAGAHSTTPTYTVSARALNRDMSVSRTSWHKEMILGRNSVFRVFRLYLRLSDLMLQ